MLDTGSEMLDVCAFGVLFSSSWKEKNQVVMAVFCDAISAIFDAYINPIMSYNKLVIWQQARDLSVQIHRMTLNLPRFEQFEEAQQIRRSSKSIRSNIVEGYGRRRYKQDFIRFLIFAQSSCDETLDHLDILYETESLKDESLYHQIRSQTDKLGRHINKFLSSVEKKHNTFDP